MRNLKLGMKLGIGFGIIVILLLIIGWVTIRSITKIVDDTRISRDAVIPAAAIASNMQSKIQDVETLTAKFMNYGGEENFSAIKEGFKSFGEVFEKAQEISESSKKLEFLKNSLQTLSAGASAYNAVLEQLKSNLASEIEAINAALAAHKTVLSVLAEYITSLKGYLDEDITNENIHGIKRRFALLYQIEKVLEYTNKANNNFLAGVNTNNLAMRDEAVNGVEAVIPELEDMLRVTTIEQARKQLENGISSAKMLKQKFSEVIELQKQRVIIEKDLETNSGEARALVDKSVDDMMKMLSSSSEMITDIALQAKVIMVSVILIVIIISVLTGVIITRALTKPIDRIVKLASKAGAGDLCITRSDFDYDGKDEIAKLVEALSSMIDAQVCSLREISLIAQQVNTESEGVASISEENSASMQEIVASIKHINNISEDNSKALDKSNLHIKKIADDSASTANAVSDIARSMSEMGKGAGLSVKKMANVVDEMGVVKEKSEMNEAEIRNLAESVEKITNFVNVITAIADQTNLLALNAAIEAARAGEAGRGFAVVADEVRKLAEESAQAAKSVNLLINSLQTNAKAAINGTLESVKIVQKTLLGATEAQNELNGVISETVKIDEGIQGIAGMTNERQAIVREMSGSIDVIAESNDRICGMISSINSSADGASKASEGLAVSAQSLAQMADKLVKLISNFNLCKDDVKTAPKLGK